MRSIMSLWLQGLEETAHAARAGGLADERPAFSPALSA